MSSKTPWVDFRALRAGLKFTDVLNYHDVSLKIRGGQAIGFCPLPEHPARPDGSKRTPSFSANLTKGIWQCFGCKRSGNVLDFSCRMQGLDPSNVQDVRTAAVKIAEAFGITCTKPAKPDGQPEANARPAKAATKEPARIVSDSVDAVGAHLPGEGPGPENVTINAPLDFELKHLDPAHPYLLGRGLLTGTIRHFGLGFCSRGMLKDRVAIPLHDAVGTLVGYAGRLVDDALVDEDRPKYRFPGRRRHAGVAVQFRKSALLYNGHAVEAPVRDLIVVEGFASVWWLWQHGYRNVVSVMGSSVSVEQEKLLDRIVQPDGHLWILTDGDEAGEHCAHDLFARTATRRFVRWVKLDPGQQPTGLPAAALATRLHGMS